MAGLAGKGTGRRGGRSRQALTAVGLLLLLPLSCAAAALSGEAAPENKPAAPPPGTVGLRLSSMGRLGFITPREARQDFIRITATGGKAGLPLAGLEAHFRGGGVAVVPAGGKVEGATAVAIPREGFCPALAIQVRAADGSVSQVALAFASAGKPGEYFLRNLTVAAGQYGDHNLILVDENCNGRYNDSGEDAVMIGGSPLAVPLGSGVMLGRTFCAIQVAENGQSAVITPDPQAKVGAAIVSRQEGLRQLIGAVLKGPTGGYHAVGDRGAAFLPAGSHSLAFAALGNPQAGTYAVLEGGGAAYTVSEAGPTAVLEFGRPEIKVSVTYDEKRDEVRVEPPKREAVTCRAGTFRFFFGLAAPKVDIVRVGRDNDRKQAQGLSMPVEPDALRAPRTLALDRGKYDLGRGRKYRFELSWPSGVVEDARGSAVLEIPLPPAPPPRNPGDKK